MELDSIPRLARHLRLGAGLALLLGGGALLFGLPAAGGVGGVAGSGLLALALIIAGGVLAGPVIAGWFAAGYWAAIEALIHPNRRFDRIPPRYSAVRALEKAGRFPEALARYAELAAQYPDEAEPHVARVRIAVERLHDRTKARLFYKQGLEQLRAETARAALTRLYEALAPELDRPPLAKRCKRLPPPVPGSGTHPR
ncbi:MAG: hypothetical protein WC789_13295 [Lentisphaeria bacterium]|jgi:hypothetical protein